MAERASKRVAVTAVGTGVAATVAYFAINVPADFGYVLPEKYVVHVTAMIVWIWNRTIGRWMM